MITSDFYDTGHGGVEGHILGLTLALQHDRSLDVSVIRCAARETTFDYTGAEDGLRYVVLPSARSRSRRLSRLVHLPGRAGAVIELLRRIGAGALSARRLDEFLAASSQADIVHQHDFLESWGLTRRLARRGYRVVWTNHLGEFLYLRSIPGGRWVLRWLTKHYQVAIAPSTELADCAAISPRVHMIPNGVDVNRFRPCESAEERRDLRVQLGWPAGALVVIVPRRWAPTKGVVYAARAMTLDRWPEGTYVVFAGSGTMEYPGYRQEVLSLLSESTVPREIHERVTPLVMGKMLRAADYCLIPSVKEATSLSALEAMASGTVVVAAEIGGLPELIEDGVTGYLHKPQSAESVAETLERAIYDSEGQVARTALAKAREEFSWDSVAMRTRALYVEAEK